MDDTELERVLRHSAPETTVPIGLSTHRDQILAEARARRRHPVRLWTTSLVVSVLIIGGGSVAMAGGGNETPWGWVADNVFAIDRRDGSACFQGFLVEWDGVTADDPMVRDAKDIVSGIDLATLDTSEIEAEMHAYDARDVDDLGEPKTANKMSDDEIRQLAINQVVANILFTELQTRGYELRVGHEVSLSSQTNDCR